MVKAPKISKEKKGMLYEESFLAYLFERFLLIRRWFLRRRGRGIFLYVCFFQDSLRILKTEDYYKVKLSNC